MTTSTWSAVFFYVFFVIGVRENHGATYYYNLNANYTEQYFVSENYPSSYPISNTYYWTITAEYDDHVVYIQSYDFSLESTSCSYDYVAAYDGTISSNTWLAQSCGTSGISATSSQRNMLVKFRSDGSVVSTGFRIGYKAVEVLTTAQIVGIVVGCLVAAGILIFVLVYFGMRYYKKKFPSRAGAVNPAAPSIRTVNHQGTLQTNYSQPLPHSYNQFGTPGAPTASQYTGGGSNVPPYPNHPPPAYDTYWGPTSSMPSAPSAPMGHDPAYPPPPAQYYGDDLQNGT